MFVEKWDSNTSYVAINPRFVNLNKEGGIYSNTSYVAINPSIYQGFFFYYNL